MSEDGSVGLPRGDLGWSEMVNVVFPDRIYALAVLTQNKQKLHKLFNKNLEILTERCVC